MLVPQPLRVMETLLEQFKPVFTKPQHRDFSTYVLGLIVCEGKKTVENINRSFKTTGISPTASLLFSAH